jgi:flagellar basal-body rod protein FlgG
MKGMFMKAVMFSVGVSFTLFAQGVSFAMDSTWPLLSGALAQEKRLEVISNNLANVNTNGFKRDMPIFATETPIVEYPLKIVPVQPTPAFGVLDEVFTDFAPAPLRETGEPLDLAIEGDGFFSVRTQDGIRYTRNGSFTLNQDGEIVTKQGYRVLSGTDPLIMPPGGGIVRVDLEGKVFVQPIEAARAPNEPGAPSVARGTAPIEVGTIFLSHFSDLNRLKKVGDTLYEAMDAVPETILPEGGEVVGPGPMQFALDFRGAAPFAVGRIRQGALEMSNVNPINEMVSMINVMRSYEAAQKALQTSDEVAGRAANDVGRLSGF